MQLKTGYLRQDVAVTCQIVGTPPMFTALQQSAQSIPNSTDQSVTLDTEIYDNLGGHVSTVSQSKYFGQFPGWYLCQGVTPLNYTGGNGAVNPAVAISSGGGSPAYYYGQRVPNSGTSGQYAGPVVAKLAQMINVGGTGSGTDYVQLVCTQNSGASEQLLVNSNFWPQFQAKWVGANSGATVASLPLGYTPKWPAGPTILTAQANSGATAINVDDPTGLVAGGLVGLGQGTATAETATIAGTYTPGALAVPLTAGLAFTHLTGATVTVPISPAFLNTAVRDTANRLLYPPVTEAYYAAGTQSLAQQNSIPTVGTTVNLDSTRVDTYAGVNGGGFSAATHTWTAPTGGVYWAYFQCHQAMNTTSKALAAGLTITSSNYNGGTAFTWWGGSQAAFAGSGAGNCAVVRRRLRLNAGDTIAAAAWQNDSGSAATTLDNITGGGEVSESRLIIIWAGQ
jgi:hypothetical protein